MRITDQVADVQSLLPSPLQAGDARGTTRRAALQLALGAGYAAATLPVAAQTAIQTPDHGLRTGQTSYEVAGFKVPAFYAAPAGKTNLPVILVVQEIFGVHAYIADIARRFARAGYLAIAPELYARQGDPKNYSEITKLIGELVSKVPDAQVMADLDGAVQWAKNQGANTQKVGITGFCWGGRITWLYAAYNPQVKAGVAWYGRLVGESTALTPKHPLEVAGQLKAPVLGLYGQQDDGIPLQTVAKMQDALAAGNAASKASRFVVYANAPHAFHADYRASFRKEPAEDAWKQALEWFKTHGVV